MESLIDYYGESAETESSPTSFQGMKEYWIKTYQSKTGGVYQWSIKDQTLLSRLMKQYSTEDIVPMIEYFFRYTRTIQTFGVFYSAVVTIYNELHKPDNYGYD